MIRTGTLVLICALALLAGCSGGGGGGAPAAEINAGNAEQIASATLVILLEIDDLAELGDLSNGLFGQPVAPVQAAGEPPVAAVTVGVDNSDLDLCLSGTVNGTVTIVDPDVLLFEDRLLAGDGVNLNLSNCVFEPQVIYSGGIAFRVARFIGTLSDPIEYEFDFTLRNLVGALFGDSFRADGDLGYYYSQAVYPLVEIGLSGRRLEAGTDSESGYLRDFNLAGQLTYSTPGTIAVIDAAYDGYLSSSAFDGEVQFVTMTPFRFEPPAVNPTQGQMQIFGAAGASILLTVVGGGMVQIDVDADGDGLYEYTESVAWAAITNLPPPA